ncbi:glycosyltransferase, partial [Chloroflexota bacterium]
MLFIGLFISFAFLIIGITVIGNLIFFPRLKFDQIDKSTLVSVLIPARDEAGVITLTVKQVLSQTFANLELLLLDDGSVDGTADLATQAAEGDERFHLLRGDPLPQGWLGKNWACHQMVKAARGDLLLFMDADVQLQPKALAALVAYYNRENVGLVTVWPTQFTGSWGERLVVPLIGFAVLGYLPILPVHYTPWPNFSAANGQCMLFTNSSYEQSGGHAAVRNDILEDVALARRVKALLNPKQTWSKSKDESSGVVRTLDYFSSPLRMVDGNQLIGCRMYPMGWTQVKDGFSKNILAGHWDSVLFLLLSTIFHWLIFIVPWLWLFFGGSWWALGLGITGITLRALTAAFTHQRIIDALLMPLSVVLMTRIAIQAIYW